MKLRILICACFFISALFSNAQVGINEDNSLPDGKAMLDIKSTSKGLLIPRMDELQRGSIIDPPISLVVYQTDGTPGFYYYTGIGWVRLADEDGWKMYGNSGTEDGVHFIGTTDDQPLNFKINNISSGRIDNDGLFLGYEAGLNNTMSYNTGLGVQSMMTAGTGVYNTAVGHQALRDNTEGGGNTAVGSIALTKNTEGYMNVAVGFESGFNNTTGAENTALGSISMHNNTMGNELVAIGRRAMFNNTTGNRNLAVGFGAGYSNQTASEETHIGYKAGYNTIANLDNENIVSPNTFIGYQAGYLNNTGYGNQFVGYKSGYSTNSGTHNVASGHRALYSNISGNGNTAVGSQALHDNTIGDWNTAFGYIALRSNIDGNFNTAFGFHTLRNIQHGENNTAIGFLAMSIATEGDSNVAVGGETLVKNQAAGNTAVGYGVLRNNTTGEYNVALGEQSMYFNTIGDYNTAIGKESLKFNYAGSWNTAIGGKALGSNTTGVSNTAIGNDALNENTFGHGNVGVGLSSLKGNVSGNFNVAVGLGSMYSNTTGFENVAVGRMALHSTTTGHNNVSLGHKAGQLNQMGSYNTFIGSESDASLHYLEKAIAIGYGAVVGDYNAMVLGGTGNNQVKVGIGTETPDTDFDIKQDDASGDQRGIKLERQDNTDDWRIYAGATADSDLAFSLNNTLMGVIDGTTGNYVPSSDMRLKTDIQPVTSVLPQIMQLEPRTYKFIGKENGGKTYGFIAQEVETVFPEFVNEREDGYLGVAYDNFTVVAIQAIKEQQVIINQQQAAIENLLQRVQMLEQK